jgi:hypothetical protein
LWSHHVVLSLGSKSSPLFLLFNSGDSLRGIWLDASSFCASSFCD